ncbi:hypothetical protein QTP81_00460 [Alteromonas sp. ASW11-36]|uniref:Anti-sigma factor n=1 Tax=Alteromonas arenosi TaxID=3055817 RepID=A0ABT7SSA4_9ALTE|nr:hypothetical protein [Alteromonas sp. ASW11-36]MDM7859073.1 hypothetical protein [Alteromonas sp. ASW11-36]
MSNSEQKLRQTLTQLPREKMPERDLWQGIELGIERQEMKQNTEQKPVKTGVKPISLAASFAIVAIAGWLVTQQLTTAPIENNAPLTAQQLAEALSTQHQSQRDNLLVSLKDQPALTEDWQQQLAELDGAANAIKAALAQDPNNTALLKMLQNVYQQQMSLIERVHSPKWRQI